MMNRILKKALAVVSFGAISCSAKEAETTIPEEPGRKVVGYLPSWRTNLSTVRWHSLTHVNLSFARVRADGSLDDADVRQMAAKLQATTNKYGIKMLLSLGGGGGADQQKAFTSALLDDTARENTVKNVIQTVKDLQLDGVDIDYEGWDYGPRKEISAGLDKFASSLRQQLGENGLLTAALSGYALRNSYYSEAYLGMLDAVMLMAYDRTGTWSSDIGPHAPYDYFVSLCESAAAHGVPSEKIIPGVPFYGRSFPEGKTANAKDWTYRDILIAYPDAWKTNSVEEDYLWYDGPSMISKKCKYIVEHDLGGVMIWEISMDTIDPSKSLLSTISAEFAAGK